MLEHADGRNKAQRTAENVRNTEEQAGGRGEAQRGAVDGHSSPLVSFAEEYATRMELVSEMNRIGAKYGITAEQHNSSRAYMLACRRTYAAPAGHPAMQSLGTAGVAEAATAQFCTARLIGLFDAAKEAFVIARCDVHHSCSNSLKVGAHLLRLPEYANLEISELVAKLVHRGFKLSFSQIFALKSGKLHIDGSGCEGVQAGHGDSRIENEGNGTGAIEEADSKVSTKATAERTSQSPCLKNSACMNIAAVFGQEAAAKNKHCAVHSEDAFFFIHNRTVTGHLPYPPELKTYARPNGTLITTLYYDAAGDPIIESLCVTELNLKESLHRFVDRYAKERTPLTAQNTPSSPQTPRPFFIIEPDMDVIEALNDIAGIPITPQAESQAQSKSQAESQAQAQLESQKTPESPAHAPLFFLKTRSVCAFLEEHTDDDPLAFKYFHECNYGSTEFLALPKSTYLRKHCPVPLFNTNNAPLTDIDFITPKLLALDLYSCIDALLWHTRSSLRRKKRGIHKATSPAATRTVFLAIPEPINDFIEEMVDKEILAKASKSHGGSPAAEEPSSDEKKLATQEITASQANATPSQANATPSQANATPSQANATPSQASLTEESRKENTKTGITETPSKDTPSGPVDLQNSACWCGKFQETLLPCRHAIKKIRAENGDPHFFISSLHLLNWLADVAEVAPVVEVNPLVWTEE